MEEFGWRGYLLPRLLKRFSPLSSSLILGLIWGGLWHGYADFLGLGDKWLLIVLLGPVLLTCWSIVMTWAYQNTRGSLLLSLLLHMSISTSAYMLSIHYSTPLEELRWTIFGVGLATIAALYLAFVHLRKSKS
jgi:uncharacterized protein